MTEYMVECKCKEGKLDRKFHPVTIKPYMSYERALTTMGELRSDIRYDFRIVAREVTKWRKI